MISSQIAFTCYIISSNVNDTMWNSTFHSFGEGELVALLDVGDALGPLLKEVDPVKQLHDDVTGL